MMSIRLLLLATTLATVSTAAVAAADQAACGAYTVCVDGGTCTTATELNTIIEQVFFTHHPVNKVLAAADVDESSTTSSVLLLAQSDNDVTYTIQTGQSSCGRRTNEVDLVPSFMTKQKEHRDLLELCFSASRPCCGALWCCNFCNWSGPGGSTTATRGSTGTSTTATTSSTSTGSGGCGRRLGSDMDREDLCEFLQTTATTTNVFVNTCLEGATVTCTRNFMKEETSEEAGAGQTMVIDIDQSLTSSSSSSNNMVSTLVVLGMVAALLVSTKQN